MDKFLTVIMVVCAQMGLIGMENGVNLMDVLVVNHGMDLLVNVNLGITLMELYACCVLMDKYGILGVNHVSAPLTSPGMATSVREECSARVNECITNSISNVCALMEHSGMDIRVWCNQNAAVGRYGTKPPSNVTALNLSTGMEPPVCFA